MTHLKNYKFLEKSHIKIMPFANQGIIMTTLKTNEISFDVVTFLNEKKINPD